MRFRSLALVASVAALALVPVSVSAQEPSADVVQPEARWSNLDTAAPSHVALQLRADSLTMFRMELRSIADASSPTPNDGRAPGFPNMPIALAFAAAAATKKGGGRKRSRTDTTAAATTTTTPATPAAVPGNPEFEAARARDTAATTGSDKTEPGGRYIGADGVARNAHGEVLDKKKSKEKEE